MKPGLSVVIADNLCQSQVMSQLIREHQIQPAVLAGARISNPRSPCARAEKCVFDPTPWALSIWSRIGAFLLEP